MNRNWLYFIFTVSMATLAACASSQVYSGLQERERNLCREGPEVEYSACMARQQMSFREYQQLGNTPTQAPATPVNNSQRVRQYVDAFNRQDIAGMLEMTTGDIRWMSIDGDRVSVETHDAEELRLAMEAYFGARPNSHSRLLSIQANGPFVTTLEQAGTLENRGQCSMAVYEFSGTLISNVWYYRAYECEGESRLHPQ
ncbi:MAG: nuclear transport factor 2 family protein [Xanthomonadales bacterium]|nr:nuclear transport factor 2 family protein [Gammaproteobacteria bacterium]NNL95121.1 nuclear transport factor 2 family protein [Xanthomonadales bacterium]